MRERERERESREVLPYWKTFLLMIPQKACSYVLSHLIAAQEI
jgi:hypothetical protein